MADLPIADGNVSLQIIQFIMSSLITSERLYQPIIGSQIKVLTHS